MGLTMPLLLLGLAAALWRNLIEVAVQYGQVVVDLDHPQGDQAR